MVDMAAWPGGHSSWILIQPSVEVIAPFYYRDALGKLITATRTFLNSLHNLDGKTHKGVKWSHVSKEDDIHLICTSKIQSD